MRWGGIPGPKQLLQRDSEGARTLTGPVREGRADDISSCTGNSTMSDPVNLLAGSIDTLSLETPSDLPAETEAPSPFPFRHLAPELRKEIILESMNPDSPRDDYVELLSVSREFHQVLAPHYWEVSSDRALLASVVDVILPSVPLPG